MTPAEFHAAVKTWLDEHPGYMSPEFNVVSIQTSVVPLRDPDGQIIYDRARVDASRIARDGSLATGYCCPSEPIEALSADAVPRIIATAVAALDTQATA